MTPTGDELAAIVSALLALRASRPDAGPDVYVRPRWAVAARIDAPIGALRRTPAGSLWRRREFAT